MKNLKSYWFRFKTIVKTLSEGKSKNEDKKRKEFILNTILLSLILFLSFANLILIKKIIFKSKDFNPETIISLGASFLILLFVFFLFYLSKKSRAKEASLMLITFLFILISKMALSWGIELPPTIIFYITLIIITGILINSRFSFVLAGFSGFVIFILNYLQVRNLTNPNLTWKSEVWDNANIIALTILFFVIAILNWLSNKETEKSLKRARKSERELETEKASLEIKVKERTKELEESKIKEITHWRQLAEFGRLSAGLFHELANPLTAINLNMEQINELCKNNPEWERFSKNIERTVNASKKMGSFLSSVRKQITRQEETNHFSLNKEIEEVLDLLEFKAKKNKVDLIFKAENEFFLFNNQIKFHQLVANLVSNAIDSYLEKMDEKNRSVVISLGRGLDEIGENNSLDQKIILSVKDNGAGLSKELQEKVFEEFFSTKSFENGTGLGLALVKSVVEKNYDGKIKIKSEEGKGSEFIIIIPER